MSSDTASNSSLPPPASRSAGSAIADDDAEVYRISGWKRLALMPLSWIVRLWTASLHIEISPESRRAITKTDGPMVFLMWHNRLFMTAEIFKRFRDRPLHALVSASKDGAWLAAFFELVGGITCVRGSSNHNARESVGLLVGQLRAGNDIAITPDGPRGPLYDFKGGGLIVARRARATMILIGVEFERAWQLRSWDRFYLPRPFSRMRVHCQEISPDELASRAQSLESLGRRLRELSPDTRAQP